MRILAVAGLVACSPPSLDAHRAAAVELGDTLDARTFERHLATLADDDMQGRDNLTPGGERARAYLIDELTALGVQPVGRADAGLEQPFDQGVNVVARVPGRHPVLSKEVVLVSAHYDHLGVVGEGACPDLGDGDTICNGAADNAAGSAAVLLIAEALMRADPPPPRTVWIVFWDAEEDGLLGSRHVVQGLAPDDREAITAMFSVDIVGTEIVPGAGYSFGVGVDHSDDLRALVHANNDTLGTTVYPVSMTFDGSGGRSDHKPFHDVGVPVIFYGSGSSPEYHSPADELAAVRTDLALDLTRHILLSTLDLAARSDRPEHRAQREPHLDDAIALRDIGRKVLDDPAGLGLEGNPILGVLEDFIARLDAYIADPPTSDLEWAEYQALIDQILVAVYAFIG